MYTSQSSSTNLFTRKVRGRFHKDTIHNLILAIRDFRADRDRREQPLAVMQADVMRYSGASHSITFFSSDLLSSPVCLHVTLPLAHFSSASDLHRSSFL